MACNIYEDPNLMDVRYSKRVREDGGERVERVVDIYESVDTELHQHVPAQNRGGQGKLLRCSVLILGLLCILLLLGSGVIFKFYMQTVAETEKTDTAYKIPHLWDCQNMTGWRRFRCSCYYKSTEKKSWNGSREDCKSRGADLVVISTKEEQEFISEMNQNGESWIGLQKEEFDRWSKNWVWKWVDGSQLQYRAWQVDVDVAPRYSTMAYVIQGWTHANNGSRHWICEKPI